MFGIARRLRSLVVEVTPLLVLTTASVSFSATLAPGDLIVTTSSCCNNSTFPDVYQLDQTGAFKGFFFSPFQASDVAVNKSGQILFASQNSGTIVETDATGSFQGFIATPIPAITGLAVEANGDIIAADGNQIYQLDPTGKFLNLIFSPVSINSSIGVDPNGNLLYPTSQCCFSASIGVLNLTTRTTSTIATGLSSISGLDVDENGNIWAIGSQNVLPCNAGISGGCNIFELDSSGNILSSFVGPQGSNEIAVANLPEPGTALLMSVGVVGLAIVRRRGARM
jgi:hypothetical protein